MNVIIPEVLLNRELVCLTGANGFVGRYVLRALLAEGYTVRVLSRRQYVEPQMAQVEYFFGDLTSREFDFQGFLEGSHALINCAGELYRENLMNSVNVEVPNRLFSQAIITGESQSAQYVFIHLSSAGVYGAAKDLAECRVVDENSPLNPHGSYEKSKAKADLSLIKIANSSNYARLILIRPTNIFAADMSNDSLRGLIYAIKSGYFFFIGRREYMTNYVHAEDVAKLIVLSLNSPNHSSPTCYNLSDDCSLKELVFKVADRLDIKRPAYWLPFWLIYFLVVLFSPVKKFHLTKSRFRALTNLSRYSNNKIQQELGFKHTKKTPDSILDLL